MSNMEIDMDYQLKIMCPKHPNSWAGLHVEVSEQCRKG